MEEKTWSNGMDIQKQILDALPYTQPFLFIDGLTKMEADQFEGVYRLKEDEYFYEGHFAGNPVTPGVILTEIAAQIGLVSFALYLLIMEGKGVDFLPSFTSAQMDFLLPVYPGTELTVVSQKEYFRFNKLKCKVKVLNEEKKVVCEGYLSGFITPKHN
jgi:3-hydroxyacyl-[acyl-carrier-protein] dehydratase